MSVWEQREQRERQQRQQMGVGPPTPKPPHCKTSLLGPEEELERNQPRRKKICGATTSTQGSLRGSSRTTSSLKSPPSNPDTQAPSSCPTAPAASTSNAKASRRFWNWRLNAVYGQCTLPTKTGSAGLHSISSSTFSSSTVRKSSWTHTTQTPPTPPLPNPSLPNSNSQKTSLPSSLFLGLVSTASAAQEAGSADATPPPPSKPRKKPRKGKETAKPVEEEESLEEPKRKLAIGKRKRPLEGMLRTFKVWMVPTVDQKKELKSAFAGARWVYNTVVKSVNDCEMVVNEETGERKRVPPNMMLLRDAVRKHTDKPSCVANLHDKIIAGAVDQACNAFKTNFAKMRAQGSNYKFRVKLHSYKHSYTETIRIERAKEGPLNRFEAIPNPKSDKRRDTSRTECLAFFGGKGLKTMGGVRLQDKPEVIGRMLSEGKILQETAKIQWDKRTDSFYFIYTYDMPIPTDPDPEFKAKRVISGDIGVNPFLETYMPDGTHGTILDDFPTQIKERCLKLDALQSRIEKRKTSKVPDSYLRSGHKRRRTNRRLRKKLARDRRRLHNWVEAAHYDAANFLLQQADILVIPKIASKRMSERETRNIRSGTVRTMLTSSPGLFIDRLGSCAVRYPGRHVIPDTGEPGTSGTVGCCGWWNTKLKVGMKDCACPKCNLVIDRQVNGARNNLLAAIGKAIGVGWDGCSM